MKMKSNFFGNSVKLALATLAVCGTMFTSCYESDDADKINIPGTEIELDDPRYYVAGTISDASTGQAIKATVTVGSEAVGEVSSFMKEVSFTSNEITVTATAAGYAKVEKKVRLAQASAGATYVADASIAMVTLENAANAIDVQEAAEVKAGKDDVKIEGATDATKTAMKTVNNEITAIAITASENVAYDGYVLANQAATFNDGKAPYVSLPGNIGYINYDGFKIIGDITAEALTRADVTEDEKDIFRRAIGIELNKPFVTEFIQRVNTYAVPAFGAYFLKGFKTTYKMVTTEYTGKFNGKKFKAIITYMESVILYPVYIDPDTHDTHDGHGKNPNAGGGSASY